MSRAAMFWSGGKDSAFALDRVLRDGTHEVSRLITTINPEYGRISMHGVREALAVAQAEAVGLPLEPMYVGSASSNDAYIAALKATLARLRGQGVDTVIFGDIFLADLRAWRESLLAECGFECLFPLWGEDTAALASSFIQAGFKAVICCVNDAHLGEADVGRALDADFLSGLPGGVDPCGENGEYHSFAHDGPVFRHRVHFALGEKIYRPLGAPLPATGEQDADSPRIALPSPPDGTTTRGFWFIDLLPAR
jgi:uncharacterized protein (TIGR00290 family)